MRADAALLLCVAIFTRSASPAARRGYLDAGSRYPSSNSTPSTSTTTVLQESSPQLSGSTPADPTSSDTAPPTRGGNVTINYTGLIATSTDGCTSLPDHGTELLTKFSVAYTSTVTFYGNRGNYTPPFEALITPNYCTPNVMPSDFIDMIPNIFTSEPLPVPGSRKSKDEHASPYRPVITFITTDKNPSVVFPSEPVPAYTPAEGPDTLGGNPDGGNHKTADNGGGSYPTPTPDTIRQGPQPTFRVTARGNQVVINDKTFSDLGPGQTTVVAAAGTFTIYPTVIVGEGATVRKPAPVGTVVSIATPTTGVLGGLAVTITGSEAIVGGATVTIPQRGTTTVVNGRRVSVGPGTLVVGGDVLSFDPVMPAPETDVLVNGGELLTAVGPSVVVMHSTTFTYGPGIPGMTEVINGETISIGPLGIAVRGMVMGGPSAGVSTTSYEIVGGVTISRIGPSIAVINGVTFTAGPGTHWTTTDIAGETFTIGPTGVIVEGLTLAYPFGSVVTTTFAPADTWLNGFPAKTAAHRGTDEDNGGGFPRPDVCVGWVAICIATGVLVLG
ncbi:Uncharacterized protein TCAP_01468 [Tolypocladium capitatum]|uniref:Uncharacterized protein n=1 Tax=Tolypocladium capitatum TaxID=45235 RepID=A0A2K3QM44_9HYPO|nr:Uncharacterized protein TCAP_01468 [Tolypocladium capitatum]